MDSRAIMIKRRWMRLCARKSKAARGYPRPPEAWLVGSGLDALLDAIDAVIDSTPPRRAEEKRDAELRAGALAAGSSMYLNPRHRESVR